VTKGRYYVGVIAAVAVLAAFACGCGGQDAVDHGGSLVSEAGQIAFTRATSVEGANIKADVYTANVDGTEEVRLTDAPGLDGRVPGLPMEGASPSFPIVMATGSSTSWPPTALSSGA
jgi:hypothetical protein